jgi:hypothetical protein
MSVDTLKIFNLFTSNLINNTKDLQLNLNLTRKVSISGTLLTIKLFRIKIISSYLEWQKLDKNCANIEEPLSQQNDGLNNQDSEWEKMIYPTE